MVLSKSIFRGWITLPAVLFLAGCVFPDLNPRHHDWIGFFHPTCDTNDVVSTDILLGKWRGNDQDDDSILEFHRGSTDIFGEIPKRIPKSTSESDSSVRIHTEVNPLELSSYSLSLVSDSAAFLHADVLTYRIEQFLLADIAPYEINLDRGLFASLYSIPSHTIWRIEVVADTLYLSTLDGSWLGEVLENDPEVLSHEVNHHGNVLITAPTSRIQAFLVSCEKSLQFTGSEPWYRISE